MRVRTILLMLFLGYGTGSGVPALGAQSWRPTPDLEVGTRVRAVASPDPLTPIAGWALHVDSDSLVPQTVSATLRTHALLQADHIERDLERSSGRGALRGLGYGALAGGATASALVLAGLDFCIYISCLRQDLAGASAGFLIGAVVGAPVGAIIGALIGAEQSQPFSRSRMRALQVSPSGAVIRLALP